MKGLGDHIREMVFRRTKILLGRLLVDGGFISPVDLERALEAQKNGNEMLGEILIRMGVLDPLELQAVLAIQKTLSSPEDAVKVAAGVRQLLGDLLVRAQKITAQQLDLALRDQERTGEKLGTILVRMGILSGPVLDQVLEFQKTQGADIPTPGPLRLGEILVSTNQITRQQLEDVLQRQKLSKKKIGTLLVEAGYVQNWQVELGLRLQHKLVTAALIGMLYFSSAPVAEASSISKVMVGATIPARANLKILHQDTELVITQADIIRGYVEVRGGSRFEVKNNSAAGYLLSFDNLDGPFKEIQIQGLGTEAQLSPRGGFVPQPYARGTVVKELDYRFMLAENAQPGTYSWPLHITARPR